LAGAVAAAYGHDPTFVDAHFNKKRIASRDANCSARVVVKNRFDRLSRPYKVWVGTFVLLLLVCLVMLYFFTSERFGRSNATFLIDRVASMVLPPRPIQAFQLTDSEKRLFTAHDLTHHWTFIIFGFTYCPDICPTTLSVMTELREKLLLKRFDTEKINFILITVDPKRDTPEILKQYVQHFDRDFLGLSGTDEQISNLAKQLGASYELTQQGDAESYTVSHSAAVYLIDPQARHFATYLVPLEAELISQRFRVFEQLYAQTKGVR
jgi:protein SCO1/2